MFFLKYPLQQGLAPKLKAVILSAKKLRLANLFKGE